ncbi:MAG: hypothetical protein HC869_07090, partial [Rhodospirillales bacterium]|nr:hypothetical protein [Rhodospirillales bacterium]
MATVFLIDSDVLSKFGRADTLYLLENLPGTVIITNEVYSEVAKGAQFAPGARAALDWMNSAAISLNPSIVIGRTYIEPTGNDMGELSIDNILNQAIAFADPDTFAVISDSPQARVVAGFFGATGGVYYGYEFLGALLAQGYISPLEYFSAVASLKLLGLSQSQGGLGGTEMFGPPPVVYGVPFGIYDAGTRDAFGVPSGDPVGTVTFFADGGFVVQLDGEDVQYFRPGRQVGYRDGVLVDADTGQEAVPDQQCFLAGTSVALADKSIKLIESIAPGDTVLSYDATGTLVPARVTRTFRNEVSHLLDVHGLKVTPGHATLCGDGMFKGRHVPIIDILLSDGALVRADGTLIRMAIDAPVGSVADAFVKVAVAATPEDMRKDT